MKSHGILPANITSEELLNTIGENVIVSDKDFNIVWVNGSAIKLLSRLAPLYDLEEANDFLGKKMDEFHAIPSYQQRLMKNLKRSHKKRISIKNEYIADIVINPIKNSENDIAGYIVLLLDVTTKAQEDERKEQLIQQLSVPMLHIWDNIMAVPLIGDISQDRFETILSRLLDECSKREGNYVLLDLSQVTELTGGLNVQINKIGSCLRLMGTECVIVGISPKLSYQMVKTEQAFNYTTFFSLKEAIKYILRKEHAELINL